MEKVLEMFYLVDFFFFHAAFVLFNKKYIQKLVSITDT